MTTYLHDGRRHSAIEKELAAPDRLYLTLAWFPEPIPCHRCGQVLATGACDGPDAPYSVADFFCDEPGQFWRERRVYLCGACRADEGYAAERLQRKRGVATGKLSTWGRSVRGKRQHS